MEDERQNKGGIKEFRCQKIANQIQNRNVRNRYLERKHTICGLSGMGQEGTRGGGDQMKQKYSWAKGGHQPQESSLPQGANSSSNHDYNSTADQQWNVFHTLSPAVPPTTLTGENDQERDYSGDIILMDTSQNQSKQIPAWEGRR